MKIRLTVEAHEESAQGELAVNDFEIERVAVGAFVDAAPPIRRHGDSTIYPVLEEVLVKRLRLREEIWVTRRRSATPFDQTVSLKTTRASVERTAPTDDQSTSPTMKDTSHD